MAIVAALTDPAGVTAHRARALERVQLLLQDAHERLVDTEKRMPAVLDELGVTALVTSPTDFPFGERQCAVQDPWGHQWTFSQTISDVAQEDWGGQTVTAW